MPGPLFDILYEQGPVLVVNKRPGILTQAPPGIDSLETRLKKLFSERDAEKGGLAPGEVEKSQELRSCEGACPPFSTYLAIIHRLDRPASGALVFARERPAARRLSKQFEQRRVAKTYWAFVEGEVAPDEGTWTDHVYKIHGMAQAKVVPPDHPGAKHAVLHYRVLLTNERGTWLEIELETGRTHQIRLQASSRGHPVLGDVQYGASQLFGEQYANERLRAIALHARSIAFTHPVTREPVHITAPPPPAWDALDLPTELF